MMDVEKIAKSAVKAGLAHLDLGVPYDVRTVVELAVQTAVAHAVKAMQPEKIKVKVKKGAKASATVE